MLKKGFAHLRNLWFSDVSPNYETLEISVLIGSDYMWRFTEDMVMRGAYEQVAIKTKLGWVISGPLKGESVDLNDVGVVNVNHAKLDCYS